MFMIFKMFFLLLVSLGCRFVVVFPLCLSPLMLGACILILRAWVGRMVALGVSSWIRILIVMVYVGGLNVLFAYFAAVMPNQYFFSSNLLLSIAVLLLSFVRLFLSYPIFFFFIEESVLSIVKLFFGWDRVILFVLAVILFLVLVAVVKVASRYGGALRSFR